MTKQKHGHRPKPRIPTLPELTKAVDDWNKKYPPGTPVKRYRLINPRDDFDKETVTAGEAFVLSAHSPMIMVKGVSGCVHLDSLEVIQPAAALPAAA